MALQMRLPTVYVPYSISVHTRCTSELLCEREKEERLIAYPSGRNFCFIPTISDRLCRHIESEQRHHRKVLRASQNTSCVRCLPIKLCFQVLAPTGVSLDPFDFDFSFNWYVAFFCNQHSVFGRDFKFSK